MKTINENETFRNFLFMQEDFIMLKTFPITNRSIKCKIPISKLNFTFAVSHNMNFNENPHSLIKHQPQN